MRRFTVGKIGLLGVFALLAFTIGIAPAEDCNAGPVKRVVQKIRDRRAPANNLAAPFDVAPPTNAAVKHPRGRKQPAALALKIRHEAALKRNNHRMKSLPKATPAAFDCRTMGWVGQVQDQGQCGSCWDVSACGVITNGYIKSGLAKSDGSWVLSPQYVLDCGQNGGCNGDDAPTVLDMALRKGLPTSQDYGPYVAGPQQCKYSNQTLYKIDNWGYCTPAQQSGIANTQDIKNAIAQYGAISSAVAANDDWDNYQGGVMPFNPLSPDDVNHDISICGWDDSKQAPSSQTPGAFLVLNQWSETWGEKGYCWIGYGSHQLGTEAAWVHKAAPLPPPAPPTPTPTPPSPTPTPPSPPTPAPVVNPTTLPPIVGAYLRSQFVHQAVKAGKDRAAAQQYASDVMTDDLLAAGLNDAGIVLPNQGKQAPAGGWLQWLITNGPAILAFVQQIVTLFSATGSTDLPAYGPHYYAELYHPNPFRMIEVEYALDC